MKKSSSIFLLLLLFLVPALHYTDAQVTVKLQQPPPNQLRVGDLWKLTIINPTRENIQITIFATLEEGNAGIVIDGNSKPINLTPGTKSITYDDVKSGNVNYKSGKWKDTFLRTGNAPSGDYKICVYIKNEKGEEIGTDCIQQVIEITGAPQLVSPADGSEIPSGSLPAFTWLPPMPVPAGRTLYKIKIVEILGDQPPEAAMLKNKAFFEKEDITIASFQYPTSAPKLNKNKRYAWKVGAGESESDVWSFIIIDESNPGSCIGIDTAQYKIDCLGVMADGNYHYQVSNLILNKVSSNPDPFIESGESDGSPSPTNYIVPIGGNTITNISPASINASTASSFPIAFELVTSTPLTNFSVTLYAFTYHMNAATNQKVYCDKNFIITFDNLPSCLCDECDSIRFNFEGFTSTGSGETGDQFNITGYLNTNVPLYGIEIQMQSYAYSADPSACTNGVTNLEHSGMFLLPGTTINGTAAQIYNETASGSANTNNNASKTVKLTSNSPLTGNIPLNLIIGLPGPIPGLNRDCCKMDYRVCIKVKVFYDKEACKTCTFTHCFEFHN